MIVKDKKEKPWCEKYEMTLQTTFPTEVSLPNCDERASLQPNRGASLHQPIETPRNSSEDEVSVNSPQTDHAPDSHPTKEIAVSSGFTFLGTLGTLALLYKVFYK